MSVGTIILIMTRRDLRPRPLVTAVLLIATNKWGHHPASDGSPLFARSSSNAWEILRPSRTGRHFLSIVVVDEPVVAPSEQTVVVLIRSSAFSRDSNASGPIWVIVVCSVGFVVVTVQ